MRKLSNWLKNNPLRLTKNVSALEDLSVGADLTVGKGITADEMVYLNAGLTVDGGIDSHDACAFTCDDDIVSFGDPSQDGGEASIIINNATGNITINASDGDLIASASNLLLYYLPTSDPSILGAVWSDSGTLKISSG